jgi:hypothetical protein
MPGGLSCPFGTHKTSTMTSLHKNLITLCAAAAVGSPFTVLADPTTGVEANTAGYTLNPAGGNSSGTEGSQPEIAGNTIATASLTNAFSFNGSTTSVAQTVVAQIGYLSGTASATATTTGNGASADVDSGVGGQPGGAEFWDKLTFFNSSVALGAPLAITLTEAVNWTPGGLTSGNPNPDFPAATVQANALMELLDSSGSASLGQIGGLTSTFQQFPGSPSTTLDHLGGTLTLDVANGSTEVLFGYLENGAATEVFDGSGTATTSAFDSIDVSYFVAADSSGTTIVSASGYNYGAAVPDSGPGALWVAVTLAVTCAVSGRLGVRRQVA